MFKFKYTDREFKTVRIIFIVVYGVSVFGLGFMQGYSNGRRAQTNPVKHIPCGYTVISYDSVRCSDGGKTKYNWHTKKRLN